MIQLIRWIQKKKMLLQQHQQDIVKDLDVHFILDELYTKRAIATEDIEQLYNKNTRAERVRYLIECLVQNGDDDAFQAFVDSLAKDYNWLWKKLSIEYEEPMLNQSLEDSLSKGDVPRLPKHYARRTAVESEIATKLSQLERHKFLVLHGMPGSGKTSVAISVLRTNSELIHSKFNGHVFWFNLSNCKTKDEVVAQQNKLYRKATAIYTRSSHMNSTISMTSFGSNMDTPSMSGDDWSWQDMRDRLKSQFSEPAIKEALLVLDEVNEKFCIEAFDVGCRILVTTRDSQVVSEFHPEIIKIENSLKEGETLDILASYLDLNVSQLPRQAKKIHDVCKGNPFNISLIGAQLAENRDKLLNRNSHWNYYIDKLEKKDYIFSLHKHNDHRMKTIKLCINSLEPDILSLFKKLAILPDNVKVSDEVLSKLWNKETCVVEDITEKLRSKSLITKTFDEDQRNYNYEVHDLIMNYLRSCLVEEDSKKLHNDLLTSYHYNANTTPIDIVDDGYIAFYIGYHILHTKDINRWKLFNKLYLNLKFLGNKVRLTGPADVIHDLQNYEKYIVEDELDREQLNCVYAFLITHGMDLYRYQYTDIVQSILQHESNGLLYRKAACIAQENCSKNELYFDFLHEQDVEEIKHSTIDVKENITSVCFLGDYVLVGTIKGLIKFFHIPTNKLKKELTGTGAAVKWVGACPIKPQQVAALFRDGFIKLWYIDVIDQDEADHIIEEESDESYNNNYPSNCTITPKTGAFINCRWSNNVVTLLTHTSKIIVVYKFDGTVLNLFDIFDKEQEILCCIPCNDDQFYIAALGYNGGNSLVLIDKKSKDKIMSIDEDDTVLDLVTVPGSNRIIALKSNEITEHGYKIKRRNLNACQLKTILSSKDIKDDLSFLAMAVNKTGSLLFVSTDDSRIICIDLKTNTRVFDLENRRGNVVTMDVSEVMWNDFEPGSDVLLTGTGTIEDYVKVWNLDASYVLQTTQKNSKVRLTKNFDVNFLNAQSPHTPNTPATSSSHSTSNSLRRPQSFSYHSEHTKKPVTTSLSLDRSSLKPLNLKGICNNNDSTFQPLLAVVDDKHNIQVIRGRKVLTEIITQPHEDVTIIKISPCNHHIIYGLRSGIVKKYTLRSKETEVIMDMYSAVQYLNFPNSELLIAGSKNCCLMACKLTADGNWKADMMQRGKAHLGSQEILNEIQGSRKKGGQSSRLSSSDSESSLTSKSRVFMNGDNNGRLRETSGLVSCFWIPQGLVTVETNAVVKLWDCGTLVSVLNARQADVRVTCAALQAHVLVVCDDRNTAFQTFKLKQGDQLELSSIQHYRLNNKIMSCDLTADGLILAMGLDSGEVVVWNVPGRRQLKLLKHHTTPVHCCAFSPVPAPAPRPQHLQSPAPSPFSPPPAGAVVDGDAPPLVLVTMASEIVWWNVTYMLNSRANKGYWRIGRNVIGPITSPVEMGSGDNLARAIENMALDNKDKNFFFGNCFLNSLDNWKTIWKGKKCKEGSKNKELLSCIKLSGTYAHKLCVNDNFSCFVTVDNSGHVHVMNVMRHT